jgi:Protein of unknown function (DUF2934)
MSTATGAKAALPVETPKPIAQNESTTEEIRRRAYDIYLSRAGAPGDELHDWLQAEHEVLSKQIATSFLLPSRTLWK